MKIHEPSQVASQLLGQDIQASKFCCGDAGTLSTSRPDIANQLKYRKENEIKRNVAALTDNTEQTVTMVTSCPACLKGLASYEKTTGIQADYIVVQLAKHLLGKDWQADFVEVANQGAVERVLL